MTYVEDYLVNSTLISKDNANHNISFSGLQSYIASEILKKHALNLLESGDSKLHLDGAIHIHNLDSGFLAGYCHGGSLIALLTKGIKCGDISSGKAKHLDTVVDHIANYLIMSQQEWMGAQSLSDFNTLLAPFVRKDRLSRKQVKQCLQRLIYNLNFPSRASFQTPFTNLTFNLNCPQQVAGLEVITGDEGSSSTYEEYQEEEFLITEVFTDILLEGDSTGRPFTFPIPTLNLTKKVDIESETFKKILEAEVKLGSFYFSNYIGTNIEEDTIRSMCCRLQLDTRELSKAFGLWNMADGTGSLQVVSLNLGRLGYLVKKGLDLYEELDKLLDSARRILLVKREIVSKSFKDGYMPLARFYNINFDHYFNTIGMVGLNEMWMNINGFGTYGNLKETSDFLDYINQKLKKFQEKDKTLYNLELTPGEGSCTRLASLDKKAYPDIITQGDEENPYYTTLLTSPHEEIFWEFRMRAEAELLPKFSGGTVYRTYLAREDEPEHLKYILKKIVNTTIPYFDFTPTVSFCPKCGNREVGAYTSCRKCNSPTDIYSRVIGYVRPLSKWSVGKQAEFWDRKYANFG